MRDGSHDRPCHVDFFPVLSTRTLLTTMSARYALQTLRSSTTLLSSRTFSRPARPCFVARHYSDKAAKEEAKDGEKSGEPAVSPVEEKLKAKEAEVVDLTVSVEFKRMCATKLT